MNKRLLEKLITLSALLIILLYAEKTTAQDLHFSQFYHAVQHQNPALTGVFGGDQRLVLNYRSQWTNVPVSYLTVSGAYDLKITNPKWRNSAFGAGILFNYDRAGDSKLTLTNFSLSVSYIQQLATRHFLSIGAMASFSQRAFNTNDLTTNLQFDGDIYNNVLPTGEQGLLFNENIFFTDFSVGLNYHYQVPRKRTKLDLGGALYHINKPLVNFYGTADIPLYARLSIFGEYTLMVGKRFDVLARASAQFQEQAREYLGGLAIRVHFEKDKNLNDLALQLGISYRFHDFGDAYIPNLEIHFNRWLVGLSYDLNISDFTRATDGAGGPELALIYKLFKVKPLAAFKNCPIF